ncbi:MAG: cellulase family glycosylhydrolase [Rhodothermales bacterium]|nr:cellulase family glycosylhydrolase [Rhodothermales bacterium]MBO6780911.1 cellulase family glycosylhydrolase [Rhodothermales bacterium]
MKRFSGFLALIFLTATATSAQFHRVEGTRILGPDGQPSMIKGVGVGGWLMPEGYMMHMGGSWTEMQEKVEELIGAAEGERLWEAYRAEFLAEKDVAAIKDWGFDHIRLPFHYEFFMDLQGNFLEEGFTILDTFLGWCETYDIPVILDLHAAPGAQSDGAIADSDGVARLWTEPDPYQDLTVALWEEFARRYKDDTRIIGYDLINEPVTPNSIPDGAQALRDLYERITSAIRAHDTNHILFIEGNYFATTFDKLYPPWDDQMVYAFHKYWNPATQGTINYLIDIRETYQRPLWLGETGENSNPWFYDMVKLMADNDIGWNFWTHKKLRSTTSPVSAPMPEGFQRLVDYWNGQAARPSPQAAHAALFEMVANLDLDSTRVNQGVMASLFNPEFGTMRQPMADHRIPGSIDAVDYDLGNAGVTYRDTGIAAISGSPGGGNNGTYLRNDGVDIEPSTDPLGGPFNVGWIEPLEWLEFSVTVDSTSVYDIDVRIASLSSGGSMILYLDGERLGSLTMPGTGGWQNWRTVTIPGVALEKGTGVLRMTVGRTGGYNVNRMTFRFAGGTSVTGEMPPEIAELRPVFPNPVSGSAAATFVSAGSDPIVMEILDMLGRRVRRSTTTPVVGENRLDIVSNDLPPGAYLLRVIQGERTWSRTFINR